MTFFHKEPCMTIRFSKRAASLLLVIFLILPIFSACGRRITLNDASYTMGRFFTELGRGDYDAVSRLMHPSLGITEGNVTNYISELEGELGVSLADGISNVRYTSYEELPYNGAIGGSKFRIYGTLNIGSTGGIPFALSFKMDSDGYGITVVDIDGVDL